MGLFLVRSTNKREVIIMPHSLVENTVWCHHLAPPPASQWRHWPSSGKGSHGASEASTSTTLTEVSVWRGHQPIPAPRPHPPIISGVWIKSAPSLPPTGPFEPKNSILFKETIRSNPPLRSILLSCHTSAVATPPPAPDLLLLSDLLLDSNSRSSPPLFSFA